jgi:hypothetical protein
MVLVPAGVRVAAHAVADWSQVTAIGIDETSSRKGRQFVTVDATTHHLLFVAEGCSSQAVEAFGSGSDRLRSLSPHGDGWRSCR